MIDEVLVVIRDTLLWAAAAGKKKTNRVISLDKLVLVCMQLEKLKLRTNYVKGIPVERWVEMIVAAITAGEGNGGADVVEQILTEIREMMVKEYLFLNFSVPCKLGDAEHDLVAFLNWAVQSGGPLTKPPPEGFSSCTQEDGLELSVVSDLSAVSTEELFRVIGQHYEIVANNSVVCRPKLWVFPTRGQGRVLVALGDPEDLKVLLKNILTDLEIHSQIEP